MSAYAAQPKFRVLAGSCLGLVALWFVPESVWVLMPVWIVGGVLAYWKAPTDDWLALPLAGLPFWWATGLAQYVVPALAGIGVLGALLAEPIRGRVRETWNGLGAEKWLALGAFAAMLPSFFAVSGGGRMFTYVRTVGLVGVSLVAMLLARAWSQRSDDARRLIHFLVAFAGAVGLWTLAQLVYKGSILLPLQRTASLLEWLPGRAGELASRHVAEAAGIKYENVGGGRLVVRPHAFFVHAVVTGAVAGLLGPLLWRRIRHHPLWRARASSVFSGLLGAALVASLARGAYLGVAIALPVFVVAFWPRLRRIGWRTVAPSILLGVAVATAVIAVRGQEARARQTSKLAEGSFVSRAAYYRATFRHMFDYPVFGHGTQRDNVAAEIVAPDRTPIEHPPAGTREYVVDEPGGVAFVRVQPDGEIRRAFFGDDGKTVRRTTGGAPPPETSLVHTIEAGTEEAVFSNATAGFIAVRRFSSGVQGRVYYDFGGVEKAVLISSPDRDPPLGSHSTLLGVGYKYGIVGLGAFTALWVFVGLRPLRRLRAEGQPMFDDARAVWVGILAFGAQFMIYEYDFDSTSPYLFYVMCGLLLGLSAREPTVESEPTAAEPAHAGTTA